MTQLVRGRPGNQVWTNDLPPAKMLATDCPSTFPCPLGSVPLGAAPMCEMQTPSTSHLHEREEEWGEEQFNYPRSPDLWRGQLLPPRPCSHLALAMCMALSGIFSSVEEKMMFQVMLFSMLHYAISQSGRSVFVHQRVFVVFNCLWPPPPPCLLQPPLPPLPPCSGFSGVL